MTDPRKKCEGCRDGASFDIPFSMAFQPIVDVLNARPFAYEALVRGPHGEGAPFILSQVGDDNLYAFDQACRVKAIEQAMRAGILDTGAKLSINFLPNAVYSPLACIQLTLRTAKSYDLPIDRLIFEFTEGEQMASPDHVENIIREYRRMGFSVAIDDFGAGYAGLGLFARFAPDVIKMDMELIRNVDHDPRRSAIVRGVITTCAELSTTVVAEGVETAAEATALAALGVRYMQGFYFAKPAFESLPQQQIAA